MMTRQWIQARILASEQMPERHLQVSKAPTRPFFRTTLGRIILFSLMLGLTACATFAPGDQPRVDVVGIESLSGQGMEMRMMVKLRVLNPNETPLEYDGVFLEMDVRGKSFAAGVSDARGSAPSDRLRGGVIARWLTTSCAANLLARCTTK